MLCHRFAHPRSQPRLLVDIQAGAFRELLGSTRYALIELFSALIDILDFAVDTGRQSSFDLADYPIGKFIDFRRTKEASKHRVKASRFYGNFFEPRLKCSL